MIMVTNICVEWSDQGWFTPSAISVQTTALKLELFKYP